MRFRRLGGSRSLLPLVLAAVVLGAVSNPVAGVSDAPSGPSISAPPPVTDEAIPFPFEAARARKSKLGGVLRSLLEAVRGGAQPHQIKSDARFRSAGLGFLGDRLLVPVEIISRGQAGLLAPVLEALGGRDIATVGRALSVRLPVLALPALETNPNVHSVRTVQARTWRGRAITQGDFAIRAPLVRPPEFSPGVTGAGVTVGLLSDSYDCLNGEAEDLANGELKQSVLVLKELPNCASGTDEGRGMAQLVADVAPDANLMFRTAVLGQSDFAQGIQDLVAEGADIIVDDIGYLTAPFFTDGVVAQSASSAVQQGVAYFSSAGNSGRQSYASRFVETTVDSSRFHDFHNDDGTGSRAVSADGVPVQEMFIPVSGVTQLSLQWDDAYASAASSNDVGAATDVDLFLIDEAGDVVASSRFDNTGGDPSEYLVFFNNDHYGDGSSGTFYIAVQVFDGPTPSRFKWIDFGGSAVVVDPDSGARVSDVLPRTDSGTLFGHPRAQGAFGVAAVSFFNAPECGNTEWRPNDFSSVGGVPLLRDVDGAALNPPQFRGAPRATGPDGGDTSFFGFNLNAFPADPTECNDSGQFPNFFGTSASAPHVAAVAALLLEANPSATPDLLYQALTSGALPGGNPPILEGAGMVRADRALAFLDSMEPVLDFTVTPSEIVKGEAITLEWQAQNATSCVSSGSWREEERGTEGLISGKPGFVKTYEYTLTCTNGNAAQGPTPSVSVTETVTVTEPDEASPTPTLNFSVEPSTITLGEEITLSWATENATSCVSSGDWREEERGVEGQVSGPPGFAKTYEYTLTCTNGSGSSAPSVRQTETVVVEDDAPVAPTIDFKVTPSTIELGEAIALTWTTTHATRCKSLGDWKERERGASGSLSGPPGRVKIYEYTLQCFNGNGGDAPSQTATQFVAVNAAGSAAAVPNLQFSVNPEQITLGENIALQWSASGADRCVSLGDWKRENRGLSGTASGPPGKAKLYSYNLTCINDSVSPQTWASENRYVEVSE